MNRRQMLTGTLAVVAGAFALPALASCSPSWAADTGTKLRFWHPLSGGDGVIMATMVEHVNEIADFDVTQTVLAWGTPYYTKLAMASAGGRAPDLAVMHATRLFGYAPGGLLDPWDLDLLAEFGVSAESFPPAVWNKGFVDGELYSIALDTHPFVLMYNTDVAQRAGVLGSDGQLEEITSPEAFIDVATRMQAVTGKHGLSYGYLGDGAQMWRLFYTLYSQRGATMDLTGSETVLDRNAAVATLDYITSLLDGTICASTGDYGTALAEFLNEESGMLFTGVWEMPTLKGSGIAFDARTIPNLFGTPAAYGDSHAFVLPRQANIDPERRRETYRFVADILTGSFAWAEAGHIPAFLPVVDSPEYAALLPQAHYAAAADMVVYDPPAWFSGSGSDFQSYFMETVQNVYMGKEASTEGIEAFVARLDALLAKPNPVTN